MELSAHPLADLIPSMSEGDYRRLREDIATHGQLEAITLYERKVLDGRHRARACAELGIEPQTVEYTGADPLAYVFSANVLRRHLTTVQRGEIGRRVLPHLSEEARKRQGWRGDGSPSGPMSRSPARDQAGALVGVSGRTVSELDQLARDAPDLHEQVMAGKKGIRRAAEETRRRANGTPPANGARPEPPTGERARNTAETAKRRLETVVGRCNSFQGLDEFPVERAMSVATSEEIAAWSAIFKQATSALGRVRHRLEGAR